MCKLPELERVLYDREVECLRTPAQALWLSPGGSEDSLRLPVAAPCGPVFEEWRPVHCLCLLPMLCSPVHDVHHRDGASPPQ